MTGYRAIRSRLYWHSFPSDVWNGFMCVPNLSSSFLLCAQKIFSFKKYGNIGTVRQRAWQRTENTSGYYWRVLESSWSLIASFWQVLNTSPLFWQKHVTVSWYCKFGSYFMDFYGTIHSRCILTFNKPPWSWHLPRIRLGPTGTFDSPADGEIITLPKETLAASFVPHPQSQIMSLHKLYVHVFL